ncbi:MAG: helix-turn-helix transcriptional regulator [Gammaproteobacteria bacterium]
MSDLRRYINKRKKKDAVFAEGFDEGYADFKIGLLVRHLRKKAGLTQLELAEKLHTQKSAISRIENQSEDIRISTLFKIAAALGRHIDIHIS